MIRFIDRRLHGDDGLGLILVIGFMGIITALVFVAGTIAVSALTSSRHR